jgi:hypothetical protein
LEIFELLSLPNHMVREIVNETEALCNSRIKNKSVNLSVKMNELEQAEVKLASIEGKWINNQIKLDTYERWYADISTRKVNIKSQISSLNHDEDHIYELLRQNLETQLI